MTELKKTQDVKQRIILLLDKIVNVLVVIATITLILQLGQYVKAPITHYILVLDFIIILCFFADFVAKFFLAESKKTFLRESRFETVLIIVLIIGYAVTASLVGFTGKLGIINLSVISIYVFYKFFVMAIGIQKRLSRSRMKPAQLFIISFLTIIAIGAILLYSPRASTTGKSISPEDAIFTATSAVCVTGLIVKDTGGDFTLFGQIVIIVLIQIGGLGIMTFAAFFSLMIGKEMGFRERAVMQDVLDYDLMGQVGKIVVYILSFTLIVEAIGAAFLFFAWHSPSMTFSDRVFHSIFHSISSFCNAGFSLNSDSFVQYSSSMYLNAIVSILIIVGGIGFFVHRNILLALSFKIRLLFKGKIGKTTQGLEKENPRLSLQSKLVLITTAFLIIMGAVMIFFMEQDNGFAGMSFKEKTLVSTFQSVTARTAGFNTVPMQNTGSGTRLLSMILMFIGASPGSTGGGIKTTTFAILLLAIISYFKGKQNIEGFKRTVTRMTVNRALTVFVISIALVAFFSLCLAISERFAFNEILFEVFSAFGTVGLSLGITPHLSVLGKVIIMLTMFIGRLGPLTIAFAIQQKEVSTKYEYPSEKVMIG